MVHVVGGEGGGGGGGGGVESGTFLHISYYIRV